MPLVDRIDPELLKAILAPDPQPPPSKERIAPPLSRSLPCSDLDTDSDSDDSDDYDYDYDDDDDEEEGEEEEETDSEKEKKKTANVPFEQPPHYIEDSDDCDDDDDPEIDYPHHRSTAPRFPPSYYRMRAEHQRRMQKRMKKSQTKGNNKTKNNESKGSREVFVPLSMGTAEWPMLGEAEHTRFLSRQTGQFYPLKYPTGDEDAAEGFRLRGFYCGVRVYRLKSTFTKQLQNAAFKTAVGFSYINIKELFPPKVVEVDPSEHAEDNETEEIGQTTEGDLMTFASDEDASTQEASSEASSSFGAVFETAPSTHASSSTKGCHAADDPSEEAAASSSSPGSAGASTDEAAHGGQSTDTALTVPPSVPHKHVNGYFAIRPSPLGGLGSFALQDIPRGTHILVERPLLRTDLFHLSHALDRLSAPDRDAYFSLTGHHPDPYVSTAERIWTANTFVAGSLEAIFTLASRFNHACVPRNNVGYHYDAKRSVLIMTTIKRIRAGAELVITYGKSPRLLFERFGFRCECGACPGFTEDMAQHYTSMKWR